MAAKAFTKQGMKLKLGTTVTELKKGADNVTCTLKAKDGKTEQVTVERVILAMGIVGNVENIGLEAAGIKVDRTHIVIERLVVVPTAIPSRSATETERFPFRQAYTICLLSPSCLALRGKAGRGPGA